MPASSAEMGDVIDQALRCSLRKSAGPSIDTKLVASTKRVLMTTIEYQPASKEYTITLDNLKAKYITLANNKPDSSTNSDGTNTLGLKLKISNNEVKNQSVLQTSNNDGIQDPKVVIFPPEMVRHQWHKIHRIGAGLHNMGNTCFFNSVLQCLTYTAPLVNHLLELDEHTPKCRSKDTCIMCELKRHLMRVLQNNQGAVTPSGMMNKLGAVAHHLARNRQEDAHECLRYLLDAMQKSSLSGYHAPKLDRISLETTVINQIFGGYHRSQVICTTCKRRSNTYDHFMDIMLDIKNAQSLEGALRKYIEPERLQDENSYLCPQCKVKRTAIKKFTIHRPPNIATFQFKRFDFSRVFGNKITKQVAYPEKFDMRPYMSEPVGSPIMYQLYAVLVHQGMSTNSGHYYCFVRNSNSIWYCMDDSSVRQVNVNHALQQQAYLLFYWRTPASVNFHKSPTKPFQPNSFLSSQTVRTPPTINGIDHIKRDNVSIKPTNLPTVLPLKPELIKRSPSTATAATLNPELIKRSPSTPATAVPNQTGRPVLGPHLPNHIKPAPAPSLLSMPSFNITTNNALTFKPRQVTVKSSKAAPCPAPNTTHSKLVPYGEESSDDDKSRENIDPKTPVKNNLVLDDKLNTTTILPGGKITPISSSVKNNPPPPIVKIKLATPSGKMTQPSSLKIIPLSPVNGSKNNLVLNDPMDSCVTPVKQDNDSQLTVLTSSGGKMKSTTPNWLVKETAQESPSIASAGSNTSVSSTTGEWTVSATEKLNKSAKSYKGWTVVSKDNSDHSLLLKRSMSFESPYFNSKKEEKCKSESPERSLKRGLNNEDNSVEPNCKKMKTECDSFDRSRKSKDRLNSVSPSKSSEKDSNQQNGRQNSTKCLKASNLNGHGVNGGDREQGKHKKKKRRHRSDSGSDSSSSAHSRSNSADKGKHKGKRRSHVRLSLDSKSAHYNKSRQAASSKIHDDSSESSVEWVEKTKETMTNKQAPLVYRDVPKKGLHGDEDSWENNSASRSRDSFLTNNSERNSATQQLIDQSSSRGYGATVKSWDGGDSHIDRDVSQDIAVEDRLHMLQEWDDEYDQGKTKKVKRDVEQDDSRWTNTNKFQMVGEMKASGHSGNYYNSSHSRHSFGNNRHRGNTSYQSYNGGRGGGWNNRKYSRTQSSNF